LLSDEIDRLGLPVLSEASFGVETLGGMEDAMRLNLFIRTGQRVLFLISEFESWDPDELYRNVSAIEWERYLFESGYLSVTSTVSTPSIRDSRFANLRCKDAIVDRLMERFGRRPDSGPERRGAVVHLHWEATRCRLFLDTSGEALSRRGYRSVSVEAPMQETLAAAVVLASGWDGKGNFLNPMCGSGTLAIEACWIALGRAPGLLRSNFGFMHLRGFQSPVWNEMRKKARAASRKTFPGKIIATDVSREALAAVKKNTETAGVDRLIEWGLCDYAETPVPPGGGIVLLNPPYGERLGEKKDLEAMYQGIGDFLKSRCQGYRGYLFTGNLGLAKKVGLRTKRKIQFFNGEIECRLLEYELYAGSRRGGFSEPELKVILC
jgi:23S rRNA G2445 N2-methylase RlmL